MSDTVITVDNLSKRYLIGHRIARPERYVALRDVISREVRNFMRKAADLIHGRQIIQGDTVEEAWALRNVSFDVKQGEVVGIIGRNGAGKTTLLKVLSRITEPTEGRATIRGRVASLLEVGTGFHPELTGRENIFLNGAILGMTQREVRRKLDEIVAFAEVDRFLDTPVKHFSSGMYVRLAFAVAAHLDPEVLIIDEVLAVGDASFQEKCLGRMKDVAASGRTVLFVSHNMSAVMQLTSRVLVLASGALDFVGAPTQAVARYVQSQRLTNIEFDVLNAKRRYYGSREVIIASLRFKRSLAHFKFNEPIEYVIHVRAESDVDRLRASMTVFKSDGLPIGNSFSAEVGGMSAGDERDIEVTLPSAALAPGSYFCAVAVGRGNNRSRLVEYDVVEETLFFDVGFEETEGGGLAMWEPGWGSIVFPDLTIKVV